VIVGSRVAARQHRPEDASLADLARDSDSAALRLHDLPGQGQAETSALMQLTRGRIELVEFDEKFRQVVGTDARAVVLYLEAKPLVAFGKQPIVTCAPSPLNFSAFER
jgi:hypothetical protein